MPVSSCHVIGWFDICMNAPLVYIFFLLLKLAFKKHFTKIYKRMSLQMIFTRKWKDALSASLLVRMKERQCCISSSVHAELGQSREVKSNKNIKKNIGVIQMNDVMSWRLQQQQWTVISDKTALKQTLFIHFLRNCISCFFSLFSFKLWSQTWNTKHTVHTYSHEQTSQVH